MNVEVRTFDRLNEQCIYCTNSVYSKDKGFNCWIKDCGCEYPTPCIDYRRDNDLIISREYYNLIPSESKLLNHEKDVLMKFHIDFYKPLLDNVKTATTRLKANKDIQKDYVITAGFVTNNGVITNNNLALRIVSVEEVLFKDLNGNHAHNEGYLHINLLKHELKRIYGNISPSDKCYVYNFRRMKIE